VALTNGAALPLGALEPCPPEALRETVRRRVEEGARLACLCVLPEAAGRPAELLALLADDRGARLELCRAPLAGASYPALTPVVPQAHAFEREIAESYGVTPVGHPRLEPLRDPDRRRFYRVEGEEVHEVAVGPVHAGVIEPGHFRFQCHGETVFHLEIALGYQHRGVERALAGGPHRATLVQIETVAGDTTVGHATAYARVVEALAGVAAGARAETLRALALELERLANHAGDLGALAGDVAFLPAAARLGALRGDYLNLTAALCGSRFGRGMVRPGGVGFDAEPALAHAMAEQLARAAAGTRRALERLEGTPSVRTRFEGTGAIDRIAAEELGLVGPAARACGAERDVRRDHPTGAYARAPWPVAVARSGDVAARAEVRRAEIGHSTTFVAETLERLAREGATGPLASPCGALAPETVAVALVEGWRGEICHLAVTDAGGRFRAYKLVDPSFRNWHALERALRGGEISDFPLVNKSFNLSYCGHDL
jgi:Ni,Fe-hydrogenase III large subunit